MERLAICRALCVSALLSLPLASLAAPGENEVIWKQMDLTGNHSLGSQIRRIEGRGDLPRSAPTATPEAESVYGMDVSSHQGNVDWDQAWADGAKFAYVKATESNSYINPYFAQQYNGSYNVGMIRGAYHFAVPSSANGTTQANYFVDHGGGWSADGMTLPGALDMEYNPYGSTCYGFSQSGMATWINDFSVRYYQRTGRYPTIYTSTSWWSQCVGSAGNFASTSPLWVARYSSTVGELPYAWTSYTFWQFDDSGTFPGDQNLFYGNYRQLKVLARFVNGYRP